MNLLQLMNQSSMAPWRVAIVKLLLSDGILHKPYTQRVTPLYEDPEDDSGLLLRYQECPDSDVVWISGRDDE